MAEAGVAVWPDGLAGHGHTALRDLEISYASSSRVKLPSVKAHTGTKQSRILPASRVPEALSKPVSSAPQPSNAFRCEYAGCGRSFTRKAKLEDHVRTHTGERPHQCQHPGCGKSFRRADHLQRHSKSHLAEVARTSKTEVAASSELNVFEEAGTASRPFVCTIPVRAQPLAESTTCGKRFVLKQHLVRHIREVHNLESDLDDDAAKAKGRKRAARAASYMCDIGTCDAVFHKRKLLRAHVTLVHSDKAKELEGIDKEEAARILRLPFACEHPGCTKRFATNSKRNAHSARHPQQARYTCSLPHEGDVIAAHNDADAFGLHFATWSDLQEHHHKCHRPKCHYPGCGKTFAEARNLRLHLARVHHDSQEGKSSADADGSIVIAGEADDQTRRYRCEHVQEHADGTSTRCECVFTKKHARDVHVRTVHLGIRDHACLHAEKGCERLFTSKRAAQRHSHKCQIGKEEVAKLKSAKEWEASDVDTDDEFRAEGGAVPEALANRGKMQKRKREADDYFADDEEEPDMSGRILLRPNESLAALLTGDNYLHSHSTSTKRRQRGRILACPWQRICALRGADQSATRAASTVYDSEVEAHHRTESIEESADEDMATSHACQHRFSRLYDAQRHIRTFHGLDLSQAEIRLLIDDDEREKLGSPRAGTQAAQESLDGYPADEGHTSA